MSLDVTSVIGLVYGDQFQQRAGVQSSISSSLTHRKSILVSVCYKYSRMFERSHWDPNSFGVTLCHPVDVELGKYCVRRGAGQ
jgi:hypothetical protein